MRRAEKVKKGLRSIIHGGDMRKSRHSGCKGAFRSGNGPSRNAHSSRKEEEVSEWRITGERSSG